MSNRMTLAQFASLLKAEVEALPMPQIAMLLEDVVEAKASARQAEDRLNEELNRRFGAEAQRARRAIGKDAGTVTLEIDDFKVRADLPKKVNWNQRALASAVATIRSWGGEDPADYVSIEYSVSEAKFAAWPPSIRKLFEPARTVSSGKPSYKLDLAKEAV